MEVVASAPPWLLFAFPLAIVLSINAMDHRTNAQLHHGVPPSALRVPGAILALEILAMLMLWAAQKP